MIAADSKPSSDAALTQTLTISLAGITDLPPGKIAAIVTSLEMHARPELRPDPPGTDRFALEPIDGRDTERYLALYRLLGERWMWFSRLVKPRVELEAILTDPAVSAYAVRQDGRDVGLLAAEQVQGHRRLRAEAGGQHVRARRVPQRPVHALLGVHRFQPRAERGGVLVQGREGLVVEGGQGQGVHACSSTAIWRWVG